MITTANRKDITKFSKKAEAMYALLDWKWFSSCDPEDDSCKGDTVTASMISKAIVDMVENMKPEVISCSMGGIYIHRFDDDTIEFGIDFHGGFIESK